MPTAWFYAPYKRQIPPLRAGTVSLYCAMGDFQDQIVADGGVWAEKECLGGYAVVKVRASLATLQAINAAAGFVKIPIAHLLDPTSGMTAAQRTAVVNHLNTLGFSNAEISAAFPLGWDGPYTLRDLIVFSLSRRQQARYDAVADTVAWNGIQMPPSGAPENVDGSVADDGQVF